MTNGLTQLEAQLDGALNEFADPRPRDAQGQFAGGGGSGASPQAMQSAYGSKRAQAPGTAIIGGQMGMGDLVAKMPLGRRRRPRLRRE